MWNQLRHFLHSIHSSLFSSSLLKYVSHSRQMYLLVFSTDLHNFFVFFVFPTACADIFRFLSSLFYFLSSFSLSFCLLFSSSSLSLFITSSDVRLSLLPATWRLDVLRVALPSLSLVANKSAKKHHSSRSFDTAGVGYILDSGLLPILVHVPVKGVPVKVHASHCVLAAHGIGSH